MGADHPSMWRQAFDGGRSWYSAMGQTLKATLTPCSGVISSAGSKASLISPAAVRLRRYSGPSMIPKPR